MTVLTDIQIKTADEPATVNSTEFERIRVQKSIKHESDNFESFVFNTAGRKATTFGISDEVEVFHDVGSPALNQIFFGRVEILEYDSQPNRERIKLGGRDYTSSLMDHKTQVLYLSGSGVTAEPGSIVRDIIWRSEISGLISVASVSGTTQLLSNYKVKNKSIYEAIQQLADIAGYTFWIDYNKGLHFEPENIVSTGYTLDNTNVTEANFSQNSQEMYNRITVYGDRQLTDDRETFTADGAGSTFTLRANPHAPLVTDAGSIRAGQVFQLTNFLPTGAHYAVDFDRRQIIFLSGTIVGNNVPVSGNSIVVTYSKSQPIIKQASDDASITNYGLKENVITNLEIKDPNMARDIALAELEIYKDPALQGTLSIVSTTISGLQPGQTVSINLSNDNVSGTQYKIFETTYDITTPSLRKNNTISTRVGNRIRDTSDILQNIIKKQRELQAQDTDTTDFISLIRSATGSFGLRVFSWYVSTRAIGSAFILDHPVWGILGSNLSPNQPYLGSTMTTFTTQQSGGGWY